MIIKENPFKYGKYMIYVSNEKDDKKLPYVLFFPDDLENNKELIVESLNLDGNINGMDGRVVDRIKETFDNRAKLIEDAPILIPIVPSVEGDKPYYQQLSKECFSTEYINTRKYDRIDLQYLGAIKDAQNKVKELTQKEISEKIFLNGYSSSGVFAQRFALIHPEIVSKCCVGGAAGSIPVPETRVDKKIGYPIGIADFEELFGKEFNYEAYRKIEFAYYVAQHEADREGNWDIDATPINKKDQIAAPMHDMSYKGQSTPRDIGKIQRFMYGEDLATRFQNSINYYRNNNYKIKSKIYKFVNHRNMFREEQNPFYSFLKQDISNFYKNGNGFEEDRSSVEKNSMKKQLEREGKKENKQEIE